MKSVRSSLRAVAFLAAIFILGVFGLGAVAAPPDAAPTAKNKAAPGRFSPADLPADRDGSAILTTPAAGRYSIRAKSPSGARIELVDMIEGPTESSGAPGRRDGRIDALLDKGAYKIRVFNAKGAAGKLSLTAEAFVELNDQRPALAANRVQNGELSDLRQRSYSLDVGPEGRVSIEAVGRALADLRLWRDNGELVDLRFEKSGVETKPGRAMTKIGLEGAVAPGRYVVTAYGGEGAIWTEGGSAQPFMLRLDAPKPLDAGLAEGVIGPFGSARFLAPQSYDAFRLELPQPAPARLDAWRGSASHRTGTIGKNGRDAFVTVDASSDGKEPAQVEVSGYEGQAFSLRAVQRNAHFTFEGSGPHLIGVDIAGQGGDEVQATALFARIEKDGKTRVLASDMPRIANGRPWRGKFNLRGTTSLLFEVTEAGPVAVEAKGVKLRATITPILAEPAQRADGVVPSRYDLAPGFYTLLLIPLEGAAGVADVTVGPPGVAASAPVPAPARVAISFGQQQLQREGSYLILGNVAPELLVGPRVVALPADLAKAPLPLWQGASETISIPLRAPKGGRIVARDSKGADAAFSLGPETIQDGVANTMATIAPGGKARALALAIVADPASAETAKDDDEKGDKKPSEAKRSKPGRAPLAAMAGRPVYFDLAQDETQEARFELAEGGLYRIETLGRMQTQVKIGATVAANLGQGENNGPGHNGLATNYLRAGAYRAAVTAKESSGRLGFSVAKAALVETRQLVNEGSARATLAPGKGAAVPFEIAKDGSYRLDLLGVGREWGARLEDSEGWPLTKPGKLTHVTRAFEKGVYRLVVSPEDIEARMVARLRRVEPAQELAGHGPHALAFETVQKLQWREPQAQGGARDPDVWRFSLKGDAEIALSLSEGMIGEILRGEKEAVGKVAGGRDFKGRLGAGDYRVEARALSRDDRLDYEISLTSKELQPETPRFVDLPAKLDFVLAKESIVDLTSFGDKELLGVLKDGKGDVIEQTAGRADDWNIALSRRLPAGAYRLELQALGTRPQGADDSSEETAEEEGGEDASAGDANIADDEPAGVALRLSLPAENDDGALPAINARTVTGAGAHVLALPPASPGTLALVAVQSSSEVALSIERREADGAWRVMGTRRGLAPIAAWPASANDNAAWRVVAWTVGGGEAPIELAFRAVERSGENVGEIALKPVASAPIPVCVGLASLPGASVVEIADPPKDLFAGSAPGMLLQSAHAGALAPQTQDLWFVAPGDCRSRLAVKSADWRGDEIALDLAAGERAQLPPSAAPRGKARLWLARAAQGRVGLDAGRGMAVSADSTLAIAGETPLRLWNAAGAGPLRLALRAVDVDVAPLARGGVAFRAVIPPLTAQPLALETGDAPLALALPAEVAAFADPEEAQALAVYGGGAPVAATHHGALPKSPKLWLVNLSNQPAPVFAGAAPGLRETLTPTHALITFFGAAGEIVAPVDGVKGDVLVALGGEARFVSRSGEIRQGASIGVDGAGVAYLDHPPGLAALWLERAGKGPWPEVAAKPVTPPQRVTLEGPAARLALHASAPGLLTARGGAPAIVAFAQNGKRELRAFPEGVELRRYLAAGEATLDLYSPHDGSLSGALDIFVSPLIEAHEGVNDAVTLAPGEAALFAFEVMRESDIGLGLRAEPDRATMRLLSLGGAVLGEGLAQSHKLAPGRYLVEARAPGDAPMSVVRLSVLGVTPPPVGPPEEVVAEYLDKAGLKKAKTR